MKLTKWHRAGIKPVHIGIYEVEPDSSSPWYSYWDGKEFGWMERDINKALLHSNWCFYERLKWRGLAEKPK